jgi:hypothetical protein
LTGEKQIRGCSLKRPKQVNIQNAEEFANEPSDSLSAISDKLREIGESSDTQK